MRGSVVDVAFPRRPPATNEALRVDSDDGRCLVLEVHQHLDPHHVRGRRHGAHRGAPPRWPVEATGRPITVPVGRETLGRLFNVLGEPLDGCRRCRPERRDWPIHRPAPPLAAQAHGREVLETGIKVIDLLAPLARGGKAGLIGGAGVGKTMLLQELIRTTVSHHGRRRLRRRRRAHPRGERPVAGDAGDRRARQRRWSSAR